MLSHMKKIPYQTQISRRRFIALSSLAAVAPTIIPASALGQAGKPAPSNRITMGVIG